MATAIQLTETSASAFRQPGPQPDHLRARTIVAGSANRSDSSRQDDDDDVLALSRAADASVPDGGYGWVVVAAGSAMLWWSVGAVYAWGVMQAALVEEGLSGPAVLSFVGSLSAAAVSIFAIVNARIMRILGPRKTGALGMTLLGASAMLSGFTVRSVGGLFCTVGVMMGFGARYVQSVSYKKDLAVMWSYGLLTVTIAVYASL